MDFISINPATGEEMTRSEIHDSAELETRVAAATRAQAGWAAMPLPLRLDILANAGRLLRERAQPLAELMAREMGKPVTQGRAEAFKCASVCDWLVEHAPAGLADQVVATEARRSLVCFRPLGLVLAIMPWNFPLWQVVRAALPALAAGNGVLLKHAPSTQGCAGALCALLRDAGLPQDLMPNLRLNPAEIAALIGDRRVAAVTLTGSTGAGRAVAELAGRHL